MEAFKLRGAYWRIEGLTMVGACASDTDCEHAIHIVGGANGAVIRGNTLVDFNAQLKGNGEDEGAGLEWPDDVVIEGNDLYDTRPRQTSNPVTKIDVVGGQRWRVEANRIADFEKAGGDGVSYGAFLKGNSKDGTFARNLVRCAVAHAGGARVGLSFGGGGTSPDSICEDGTCSPEHQRGTLVNNVIVGCSDMGVYLNEAEDTRVIANTLYATAGIDVRFAASTAWLTGNVLDGRIRERDSGTATVGTNWAEADLDAIFVDPAALDFTLAADPGLVDGLGAVDGLDVDFCGVARDDAPDGGAFEFVDGAPACDATRPHAGGGTDTGGSDTGGDTGSDTDGGGEDSGSPDDSPDGDTGGGDAVAEGGCGCATGGAPSVAALGLAVVGLARRGRRSRPSVAAGLRLRRV